MAMMISVVIAAYNEEARIVESFFKVRNYLTAQDVDYEIIVVDDGSTDKADDVEIFLLAKKKGFKVLEAAVRWIKLAGVKSSSNYRFVTDAF